ncbi:hypothetical protein WOLCODRAFT_152481 [Wolfiporia cocos MD-104 SS10]|uniref:Uncharacterized protein n=1 Tax=Wolfiporia cocos (strain MD-104) TaxID=742152 RepID=A0A2H3JKQ9_WOLCO|nr:hypothetical protein WOLCODRAFT_152481 [Wolfiporia cocos MD-104 SS10]
MGDDTYLEEAKTTSVLRVAAHNRFTVHRTPGTRGAELPGLVATVPAFKCRVFGWN